MKKLLLLFFAMAIATFAVAQITTVKQITVRDKLKLRGVSVNNIARDSADLKGDSTLVTAAALKQLLSGFSGGGGSSNFANSNLTATGNRTHDFDNKSLTIKKLDTLYFSNVPRFPGTDNRDTTRFYAQNAFAITAGRVDGNPFAPCNSCYKIEVTIALYQEFADAGSFYITLNDSTEVYPNNYGIVNGKQRYEFNSFTPSDIAYFKADFVIYGESPIDAVPLVLKADLKVQNELEGNVLMQLEDGEIIKAPYGYSPINYSVVRTEGTDVTGIPITGNLQFQGNRKLYGYQFDGEKSLNFGEDRITMNVANSYRFSDIEMTDYSTTISTYNTALEKGKYLSMTTGFGSTEGILVSDDLDGVGLIGAQDFSANASSLSYVQKKYVDSIVGAIDTQIADSIAAISESIGSSAGTLNLSGDRTITAADFIGTNGILQIFINGSENGYGITLPLASTLTGKTIQIVPYALGDNDWTVLPSGESLINGLSSLSVNTIDYNSVIIASNGTNYFRIK